MREGYIDRVSEEQHGMWPFPACSSLKDSKNGKCRLENVRMNDLHLFPVTEYNLHTHNPQRSVFM